MPTPEARAYLLEMLRALPIVVPIGADDQFCEALDRFAAQRGAAADRLVHLFARVIVEGDGAFTGGAWEATLCEAERINRGAPPQTGGAFGLRDRPELTALIEKSRAAYAAMSPEEREAHDIAQRESWVRGNIELDRLERQTTSMAQAGGGDAPFYDASERAAIKGQLKAGNAIMRDAAKERTGGGDAEWVCAVLYRVTEYLAKTGTFAEEDIAALRKALAMLDALHKGPKGTQTGGGDAGELTSHSEFNVAELCARLVELTGCKKLLSKEPCNALAAALRSSRREGAEAISDDMNAAHWHGYRDGAEAMREACAQMIEAGWVERAPGMTAYDGPGIRELPPAIRALSIPGSKTDAG
jgi:hypothetical protein